jgi:hypothetical protein
VRVLAEFAAYTDSNAVTVFTPSVAGSTENPASGWSATGSYLVDVVSAASPDIVSTASNRWQETRQAASVSGTYAPGSVGGSLAANVSSEPDYLSLSASGTLSFELADKQANPSLGYAYTHDTAGRTGTSFAVFSQELVRHTATASVEFILNDSTSLTLRVDGMFERGDQTKPYRLVPLFTADVARGIGPGESGDAVNAVRLPGRVSEATPLSRNRAALSGRFAHRFGGSTLVATERLYGDDWGLLASTSDLRFEVDLSRRTSIWLHAQANVQNGVTFWKRAYVASVTGNGLSLPQYRTGDRELSPLKTGGIGTGLQWMIAFSPGGVSWSLIPQFDFMATEFSDALFVRNRQAYLGVLQLEAAF